MKHFLPIAFAMVVSTGFAHAATLKLVQNARPNATIVLQAGAPKPMQDAALDLQLYIRKISGVKLPLRTDGKDVPGITLNIGKTDSMRATDLPDAKLNPESYAIRQRGERVYFTGRYPTPAAFAVYSFLQDQLGVRWFAPGDDWEYVPKKKNGNYSVDVKDVVKSPGFSPRVWSGHDDAPSWPVWNVRNKTVTGEKSERREFQNNMHRVFPPSKYAATHPEYYPLIDGKRRIPTDDSDALWWPCMGNPDVRRITIEYARNYFVKHPETDSFSLGMDDIAYMCSCPLCRAMDAHPDDYEKRKFSDRFYKFINIVARGTKQTNPDKYIGTLIYSIARELPAQVDKLEDNVFGYITENTANWYNPDIKRADQELTRQWAKRVKHLSRYDYVGFGSFAPRVYPHLLDESMKFDKSLGFEGMYVEIYGFVPHQAPMLWSMAQLQWDAKKPVDVYLNDFYGKMFPSTKSTMKEYFDLIEKSWSTSRPGHNGIGWEHADIVHQATSVSADDTRRGLQLLDNAYNHATGAVEKRRIDVVRGGLRYAGYAILTYDLARRINALQLTDASEAAAGRQMVAEFARLLAGRNNYWTQARTRQDLLGENLRYLYDKKVGDSSYLQMNTTALDGPAVAGVMRLVDWYYKNEPKDAAAIAHEMVRALPAESIGRTVSAWNWVAANKPVSRLKNGTFDEVTSEVSASGTSSQPDWNSQGGPAGWNTWSSLGHGKYSLVPGRTDADRAGVTTGPPTQPAQSENRTGDNSTHADANLANGKGVEVRVPMGKEALGDHAVVLQNVPVQAGKKYLGIVWAKPAPKASAENVSFSLYMRTKDGWYTGEGTLTSISAANNNWQPLMLSITVPETVTEVTFMMGAQDSAATFDDAAFYEIP